MENIKEFKIGQRIDVLVTDFFKKEGRYTVTRSLISKDIPKAVLINGSAVKKSYKLREGDEIQLDVDYYHNLFERGVANDNALNHIVSERGELNIVEEGGEYIVLNKSKGLVVHPGIGNTSGTLANYLKGYLESNNEYDSLLERAGIVHRLDKGVSGLIIVAKTRKMQLYLKQQFEEHKVLKVYKARVQKIRDTEFSGLMEKWVEYRDIEGLLEDVDEDVMNDWYRVGGYIKRDSVNRMRMVLSSEKNGGKRALSYIYPLSKEELLINIRTGRMHQIRASLRSLGYAIVGDELYGYKGEQKSVNINLESVSLQVNLEGLGLKTWRLI